MVKMCDLSEWELNAIVLDVSDILRYRYHVDKESIDDFLGCGTNRNRGTDEGIKWHIL